MGVAAKRIPTMRSFTVKPGRIFLGSFFVLSLALAVRAAGHTPTPSAAAAVATPPFSAGLAAAAPTAPATLVPTPPELAPVVRAVGIHSGNGEERNRHEVYVQRGDEIWVDIHNFQGWLNSLGPDRLPKNHEVKNLILISIIFRSPAFPRSIGTSTRSGRRRARTGSGLHSHTLSPRSAFPWSAMTARSPVGRTSSISRSCSARCSSRSASVTGRR